MRAQSPTWEDSLEKSMETHSGILFFFFFCERKLEVYWDFFFSK